MFVNIVNIVRIYLLSTMYLFIIYDFNSLHSSKINHPPLNSCIILQINDPPLLTKSFIIIFEYKDAYAVLAM